MLTLSSTLVAPTPKEPTLLRETTENAMKGIVPIYAAYGFKAIEKRLQAQLPLWPVPVKISNPLGAPAAVYTSINALYRGANAFAGTYVATLAAQGFFFSVIKRGINAFPSEQTSDVKPFWKDLAPAVGAGILSAPVVALQDNLVVRQHTHKLNSTQAIKTLLKEGGIRRATAGTSWLAAREGIFFVPTYMLLSDKAGNYLSSLTTNPDLKPYLSFSGVLGTALLASLLSHPVERFATLVEKGNPKDVLGKPSLPWSARDAYQLLKAMGNPNITNRVFAPYKNAPGMGFSCGILWRSLVITTALSGMSLVKGKVHELLDGVEAAVTSPKGTPPAPKPPIQITPHG